MDSSDFTRLDYKTINEFFPKGQLSILAAGPGVGKTVCYSWLGYQMGYLKANYPEVFNQVMKDC